MLYDITPPLTANVAVFPGDTPLRRRRLLDMDEGHHITLSSLTGTVHLGAHADAPSHYGRGAATMEEADLGLYLGPCRVVEARWWPGERISAADLGDTIDEERLLVKTGSWPDPEVFNENYAALSPEAIHRMADEGVKLVGVDVPSVDAPTAKDLVTHHACLERDVRILECLDLSGVPEGRYELIALPLKLVGFEASPVRAVLRPIDEPAPILKKAAVKATKVTKKTSKKKTTKKSRKKSTRKKTKRTTKKPARAGKKTARRQR